MRVDFNRALGYGDSMEMDLDVVPRVGDDVHWDGRRHRVLSVVWFLNDPEDPEFAGPVVRVNLDAKASV